MNPATTLREAYGATDPRPLPSGDPYFVDLRAARNSQATVYMQQMIRNCGPGHSSAIAFSGHRGSGKSTELRRLEDALSPSCYSLYLDVNEFLDAADVDYTDLFLLVCRRLLDQLQRDGVALDSDLLKGVEEWFASVTKENEESVKLSAGVSTEAKAGVELPFIARLLAKLTADVKAGSSHKVQTRIELDRYFSGLLTNTNLLLAAAAEALAKQKLPSQVLIVVDNLDRVPPHKSERLFFTHGSQLQDLGCHAVYTISIETFYSHQGIGNVFPNHVILPNVKLRRDKAGSEVNVPGVEALTEVVARRIATDQLLQPTELVKEIVSLSGGSVRQLIRLLRQAVLSSQARSLGHIDAESVSEAAKSLQLDFQRSLLPTDYQLLAATSRSKQIEKTEEYMKLLSNMAILEYNGSDLWHDVNPLVEQIDAFQNSKGRSGRKRQRRTAG